VPFLALFLTLALILTFVILTAWSERKVAAWMQDRVGPDVAGPYGLLQPVADVLKLLQKEFITPAAADPWLFRLAPILVFTAVLAGFAVIPLAPGAQPSGAPTGVFYLLAVVALDVVGLLLAGFTSANKFAVLGALRSVAQIVSYEIPAGLAVLAVTLLGGSLDLQVLSYQQGIFSPDPNWLFGIHALGLDVTDVGGILTWNIVRMPLLGVGFIIYYLASLAECNRAPFDLPEAESELVAGIYTEYAGFRYAALFLAEYAMMVLVCVVAAVLFLGSWNTPLPNLGPLRLASWTTGAAGTFTGVAWAILWLGLKVGLLIFGHLWARWTYPRLRVDQLLRLCWKVLTPAALVLVVLVAIWRIAL
jgi:NADH-quinone oxidoreductase subunit H